MKLIDRKPTPEMIEAMHERGATLTGMFQAAYDAAPELNQEPVAWLSVDCIGERYLCFSKPVDNDPVTPLYTYPPYAQAEITKRDARIAELEETLVGYKADQADLIARDGEQAVEIARLKVVTGKCKEVLEDCHQNINQERGFASEIERDIEQTLDAIKDEGL